jgi:ribosomal protein S18 acetylase RimI-like enzyme
LSEVFSILQQAQELVGGRVILLECEDNEKLINLYRNNGFEVLQKFDLVQMYLIFDITKQA